MGVYVAVVMLVGLVVVVAGWPTASVAVVACGVVWVVVVLAVV